jgi:hypothetical protein
VGLVVDSLNGGPLVGAQVSVEGIAAQAVTDSLGRFRIDSVPAGPHRIGVFHPLLDSLGVSIASPPLTVIAGAKLSLIFATPSAPTIVRLTCGVMPPIDSAAGIGPSVLIGRVLDAETDGPAAGVRVSLRWAHLHATLSSALHRAQSVWDTTTGPTGEFRFCHLPAQFAGLAVAVRPTADSSGVSRLYAMRGRLIGFVVLHVPSLGAASRGVQGAASDSNPTSGSGRAVLTGRVTRTDDGGPFVGALVTVAGTGDTAVTGDNGQFTLRGLPTGSRTLEVRALGWEPEVLPVELTQRTARHIVVPLVTKTAVLEAVVVTATLNVGLHRIGFDSRKQRGVGHFITADDIAKRTAMEFVDLMTQMPGVVRRMGPFGEDFLSATRGTGGCVSYVIDGMPYEESSPGDINIVVPLGQIGAVEVYQPSEQPAEYAYTTPPPPAPFQARTNSVASIGHQGQMDSLGQSGGTGCVKIIIWTKSRLGI